MKEYLVVPAITSCRISRRTADLNAEKVGRVIHTLEKVAVESIEFYILNDFMNYENVIGTIVRSAFRPMNTCEQQHPCILEVVESQCCAGMIL